MNKFVLMYDKGTWYVYDTCAHVSYKCKSRKIASGICEALNDNKTN